MRKPNNRTQEAQGRRQQRRVRLTMTYQLAWAAAQDHGNRHARRGGRTAWNSDDFNAASLKLDELIRTNNLSLSDRRKQPTTHNMPKTKRKPKARADSLHSVVQSRASNRNVDSLPVKSKLKDGQIVVEQKVCGIIFSFPACGIC